MLRKNDEAAAEKAQESNFCERTCSGKKNKFPLFAEK